jgi:hypothetical protein
MQVKPIKTIKTMKFDLQFDPYNRNYVVTTEVSPELAERLMANPEDRETLAKEIQSAILAAFTHSRVVQPEDIKKARIIHREDAVQEVMDPTKVQIR